MLTPSTSVATPALLAAALTIIVGQAFICVLILRFVKTFGHYTQTLLDTHNDNRLVQAHNIEVASEIGRAARLVKRATDTLSDRSFGIPSTPPQEKSA